MKITTVKYGRTFALGNFASERIDLEASIDEGKESAIDAFNQLREYAEQIHMKNHPHLYQQTHPELYSSEQTELPVQEIENKLSMEEITIQGIKNCLTFPKPDGLDQYTLLFVNPKTPQSIKDAYSQRLAEITGNA